MFSFKATRLAALMLLATVALHGDTNTSSADLDQARAALAAAEAAGAPTYAKTLYDEAAYRVRFAQDNWNGKMRNQAQYRALEAIVAARAASAKARWLSTNAAIRTLQEDITRFGGHSDVMLRDEAPSLEITRGATTKDRIATAQGAIDQARSAGAEQLVVDNELVTAQKYVESARAVSRNTAQSEVGDDLAYRAEMIARRAYYLARLNESNRSLPDIQLMRTRLAQGASERQAAVERAQRQEAERRAAELQSQLAAEQANRQAQAAELDRLRQQIDATRRAAEQQRAADRVARLEAERRLDDAFHSYEASVAGTASPADIDTARRNVEDAQIALRAAQERERLALDAMTAEADRMRNDLEAARNANSMPSQVLAERQAGLISRQQQLEQFRAERQDDINKRNDVARQQQAAMEAAQRTRQHREAREQALRQEAEEARQRAEAAQQQTQVAQQQAQQASRAAQTAQATAQNVQAELEKTRKETAERDARAQAQVEQVRKETAERDARAQAQMEQVRKETAEREAQSKAQLDKAQAELAQRDAEARQMKMQQELARIASTRKETRGFIVTLPGIFFDTGKTELKSGAKATLGRIAEKLKGDDSIKIAVEGHTDTVGGVQKNQQLSEKRAQAVRDYLVNAGFAAERITASGKGPEQPVATNKTAAGRQQNRRVELVITQ